jgi:hypothetical protein
MEEPPCACFQLIIHETIPNKTCINNNIDYGSVSPYLRSNLMALVCCPYKYLTPTIFRIKQFNILMVGMAL